MNCQNLDRLKDGVAFLRRLRVVWGLCGVLLLGNQVVWAGQISLTNVPLGVVRITQSRFAVPIPKVPLTFSVGTRVRLVQENEDFYIVAVDDVSRGTVVVAAPRRKGSLKRAWATPENFLFFAYETECVDGVLYLTMGDELPVLAEDNGFYQVQLKRGADCFELKLPKTDPAVYFIPNPVIAEQPETKEEISKRTVSHHARKPIGPTAGSHGRSSNETPAVSPSAQADQWISVLDTNWDISVLSFLAPDEWAVEPAMAAEKAPAWWRRFDFGVGERSESSLEGLLKHGAQAVIIGALLLMLIVAGSLSALQKAKLKKKSAAPPEQPKAASSPEGEPAVLLSAPPAPDFSGSLASMSLNAVLQFLNTDKESGKLTISDENHSSVAVVYFMDGEIVDAQIGSKSGVEAVYEIVGVDEGHFAFIRSKKQQVPRVIDVPTLSLLLEANRLLDEKKEKEQTSPEHAAKTAKRKDSSLRLRRHAGR